MFWLILKLYKINASVLRTKFCNKCSLHQSHELCNAGVEGLGGAKPEYGEDDHGGEDGSEGVGEGDDEHVPLHVLLLRVVGGERRHPADSHRQAEEDLRGGVQPNRRVLQNLQLFHIRGSFFDDFVV